MTGTMGTGRAAAVGAAAVLCAAFLAGCGGAEEVVVYTSVDSAFAREVFAAFEKQSGIRVRPRFDAEAAKTTGLVSRLLKERSRPRADVFWSSEWFGTQRLAAAGVLAPYRPQTAADIPAEYRDEAGRWTAFAARPRVLVFNTRYVPKTDAPRSVFDLTRPPWRGRVTMANPLFGTTRGWAAAMVVHLGEDRGNQFLRDLRASCLICSSNSDVVRRVASAGSADDVVVGLTDADDVWVQRQRARERGEPPAVDLVYLDQGAGQMGTLMIPNSVALVRGAPHEANARTLIEFLAGAQVERLLAESRSHNVPVRPALAAEYPQYRVGRPMRVDAAAVAERYGELAEFLGETFTQ